MRDIAKPLEKHGIYFSYIKGYKDKTYELLATSSETTEGTIKEKLYQKIFCDDISKYISCYSLWKNLEALKFFRFISGGFGLEKGIVLIKNADSCEFIHFSSKKRVKFSSDFI